jgi:hypothetical protein
VEVGLTSKLSVTGTFLLNITDLDTGPGTHRTRVMPGFTVGVRF